MFEDRPSTSPRAMKLTENQRRELQIIGDPSGIARGYADDLRAAAGLERKGLIELLEEWTERSPSMGRGPAYIVRVYRLTDAGEAALAAMRAED